MTGRSAWVVSEGAPTRLVPGGIDYEKDLEDLIVRDPSMLGPADARRTRGTAKSEHRPVPAKLHR